MTEAGTFTARLLREAEPIWAALIGHPFVVELAEGRLDPGTFDFWVQQDHYFVEETRRLWAYAAARAPDEEIARTMLEAANALAGELHLFRDHAAARGLPLDVAPAPICQGYASFALHTASFGDFLDLFSVVFGAEKAYFATWSAVKDRTPVGSAYAHWIGNWTSPAFGEFVGWIGRTLDRLAEGQPAAALDRARAKFLTSARFEYLFWDACYRREGWPI